MKEFLLNTFLCSISDDSLTTNHIIEFRFSATSKRTVEPSIIHHELFWCQFFHLSHLLLHCSSRIFSNFPWTRRSIGYKPIEIISEWEIPTNPAKRWKFGDLPRARGHLCMGRANHWFWCHQSRDATRWSVLLVYRSWRTQMDHIHKGCWELSQPAK